MGILHDEVLQRNQMLEIDVTFFLNNRYIHGCETTLHSLHSEFYNISMWSPTIFTIFVRI